MVQVAEAAQWRFADDAAASDIGATSAANRRNIPLPDTTTSTSDDSRKWRPGLTGDEAKARAKELRKAVEQRGEKKLALRHAKQIATSSADQAPTNSPVEKAERDSSRLLKPAAILQRLIWQEGGSPDDVAVWLLHPEGDACGTRWCRTWVRTAACRFGASCRHAHGISLTEEGKLSCSRGAAMPPISKAENPHDLDADATRHIAFIFVHGRVAYDYEDPAAATTFAASDSLCTEASGEDEVRPPPLLPDELWSAILIECDAMTLSTAACVSCSLAAVVRSDDVWTRLQANIFGSSVRAASLSRAASPAEASGRTRRLCVQSELALSTWRDGVASTPPITLPLPSMTSVCLAGDVGVSTHDGRLTRIWEASTGRRIACHQHKSRATLTCCDASSSLAVVGDTSGVLHVFSLDEEFVPSTTTATPDGAISSVLVIQTPQTPEGICVTGHVGGTMRIYRQVEHRPTADGVHMMHGRAPVFLAGTSETAIYRLHAGVVQAYDATAESLSWEARFMDVDGGATPPDTSETLTGRRPLSYSPGWHLVGAICMDGGSASLWDPRVDGARGPACRLRLPNGDPASSIHLDAGASGLMGHALLSGRQDGAVHVFDIRRVHCGSSRPAEDALHSLAASTGTGGGARHSSSPGWCFAADEHRYVTASGPKATAALIWNRASAMKQECAQSASGSGRNAWRLRYADEQAQASADAEAVVDVSDEPSTSSTPRTKNKNKPKRQTKKQWSH